MRKIKAIRVLLLKKKSFFCVKVRVRVRIRVTVRVRV